MTPNFTYLIIRANDAKVICSITIPTYFKNNLSGELIPAMQRDEAMEILNDLRDKVEEKLAAK